MPRGGRSETARRARGLRAELWELRAALEKAEADPTAARIARVLERRSRGGDALQSMVAARPEPEAASPVETRLTALWSEVEAYAADPVGQRVRLDGLRAELDQALDRPDRGSFRGLVIGLPGEPGAP